MLANVLMQCSSAPSYTPCYVFHAQPFINIYAYKLAVFTVSNRLELAPVFAFLNRLKIFSFDSDSTKNILLLFLFFIFVKVLSTHVESMLV